MMYEINKKYFDEGPYTELEKFHLKNIKILEEPESYNQSTLPF